MGTQGKLGVTKSSVYKNSICLVTGAASGIGKSLCRELIKTNARRVFGADVNEKNLALAAFDFNTQGETFVPLELDVTDYDAFKEVIDDIVLREGRLDFIFNNAGITIVGETRDLSIEHWRKVLNINLNGVVHGTYLAYKQMVKQGHGHIVNTSSIQGFLPLPVEAPYVTSKFGVMGISQALRVEGEGWGVKVSVACPGYVKTAILESPSININKEELLKSLSAWERFAVTPDKCARIILAGVRKNKPIITVTPMAKWMWWLSRLSPFLALSLLTKGLNKVRPGLRLSNR